MKVKPKIFKNMCISTHPEGCFKSVDWQVEYVKEKGPIDGPKKALILGSSTGYGLASRIVSAYGSGAATIGVAYEKPGTTEEMGSVGWYNTLAFDRMVEKAGLYSNSIYGDAFSSEIKQQVIESIKKDLGSVDLVIYSLASMKRFDPVDQELYSSAIKPIGEPFTYKTLDIRRNEVYSGTVEPATEEEIAGSVKVMGGEDWQLWIEALNSAGVLSKNVKTISYSYIGPEFTYPIYRGGTLGVAKKHLEETAGRLNKMLAPLNGQALVSVNKALITRASAVIPAVPLYISILYTIMKREGIHEDCIHQIYRLFNEHVYVKNQPLDEEGRLRIDDWELREDIQAEVTSLMESATTENLLSITDLDSFKKDFLRFHGFSQDGVDYHSEFDLNKWV
jgi:enoyl-[acyl-carrier protein] reductase/trans-2-enoyl-CoA reductase (NAD+)